MSACALPVNAGTVRFRLPRASPTSRFPLLGQTRRAVATSCQSTPAAATHTTADPGCKSGATVAPTAAVFVRRPGRHPCRDRRVTEPRTRGDTHIPEDPMKAVTWQGKRDVRVETVPDPTIQEPTDALVRITSTALCGSDLHLYEVLGPF